MAGVLWFFAVAAYSLVYLYSGFVGLADAAGVGWALGALAMLVLVRLSLPITVGAFLCASEVWRWHWAGALAWALPGLLVVLPGMLTSAVVAASAILRNRSREVAGGNAATQEPTPVSGPPHAIAGSASQASRSMVTTIGWVVGACAVLGIAATLAWQEHQNQLLRERNLRWMEWIRECPSTPPKGVLGNLPKGPTAWERSNAILYLEGRGPQPDIPCDKRVLLNPPVM